MNALWDYYWPVITLALVIGVIAGAMGFGALRNPRANPAEQHQQRRVSMLKTAVIVVAGMATTLAVTVIWHGPLGGSDRFASYVDGNVEQTLRDYEMTQIQAQLHQAPLRRTIVLSGPADNFQRGELVRILDAAPGVADVHWAGSPAPARLPLLAEAELSAVAGFALGLVLSYLLELRRRSRSEWRW